MNACLLGTDVVTTAIKSVLSLLEVGFTDGPCDICIVVDGDQSTIKLDAIKLSGKEKLIYIESDDKNTTKHNLYFLTELLPTYRIPLEQFSIVELARIVADIKGGKK